MSRLTDEQIQRITAQVISCCCKEPVTTPLVQCCGGNANSDNLYYLWTAETDLPEWISGGSNYNVKLFYKGQEIYSGTFNGVKCGTQKFYRFDWTGNTIKVYYGLDLFETVDISDNGTTWNGGNSYTSIYYNINEYSSPKTITKTINIDEEYFRKMKEQQMRQMHSGCCG